MVKEVSFIEGLFYGTVCLPALLGLQHCCRLKIIILILDICFVLLYYICVFAVIAN